MSFFQVSVYWANGSILRSTPMLQQAATDFTVSFVKQVATGEVVSITSEPMSKEDAQAQFRADAVEWKKFGEETQQRPWFDPAQVQLACRFHSQFMTVGCSG